MHGKSVNHRRFFCGFRLLISHLAFAAICNVWVVFWLMPTKGPLECPPCIYRRTEEERNERNNKWDLSLKVQAPIPGSERNVTVMMPPTLRKLLVGMGLVNRDDFGRMFDAGVPLMPSTPGNEDVLILYGENTNPPRNASSTMDSSSIPRFSTAHEATKRCITMKLVMVPPNEPDTCVAIMGQWPSFYVHKWMRVPKKLPPGWIALWNSRIASLQYPLRPTSRSHTEANTYFRHYEKQKPEALTFLANYIHQVNDTLRLLRPVLTPMTTSKPYNNTIVVMVCNKGQSELFLNFVCSARSRGLDLSQVLLFATDAETKAIGDSLGINTFYDTKVRGE